MSKILLIKKNIQKNYFINSNIFNYLIRRISNDFFIKELKVFILYFKFFILINKFLFNFTFFFFFYVLFVFKLG
jgi:hypothetical protein